MNAQIKPNDMLTSKDVLNNVVRHAAFRNVLEHIMCLIADPGPTRLVFVPGPSGVGKSTLIRAIQEDLKKAYPDMLTDPNVILHAYCSVKAPGPRPFSWKDFYIQLLESLEYPFADRERALVQPRDRDEQMRFFPLSADKRARTPTELLFRVLQHVIELRKPRVVLIDEAHHFARIKTAEALRQQLEHLKYLADETGTLFVLFSTYELVELAGFNGQLLRRSETLPFHRYRFDPQAPEGLRQLDPFARAVLGFESILRPYVDFKFDQEIARFYRGSLGCIGILRDWLGRAWVRAQRSNHGRISLSVLDSTMLRARDLRELLEEATVGERAFELMEEAGDNLWSKLGISGTDSVEKPRKKRPRPGTRKPHRDPVGVPQAAG